MFFYSFGVLIWNDVKLSRTLPLHFEETLLFFTQPTAKQAAVNCWLRRGLYRKHEALRLFVEERRQRHAVWQYEDRNRSSQTETIRWKWLKWTNIEPEWEHQRFRGIHGIDSRSVTQRMYPLRFLPSMSSRVEWCCSVVRMYRCCWCCWRLCLCQPIPFAIEYLRFTPKQSKRKAPNHNDWTFHSCGILW